MNKKYQNVSYLNIDECGQIHNKKVLVYGAGIYGTILCALFDLKGMNGNEISFVVSDENGNPTQIFGRPVRRFEDIHIENNETLIIIAVNEKKADAIIDKLQQRNIKKFFLLSEDFFSEAQNEIKHIVSEKYSEYPIQRNKVFFYCYTGLGYRCNCKYIAEKLLEGNYPVELVWALTDLKDSTDIPKVIKVVKTNTKEYYEELYTSSIIIENCGKDSWVIKKEGQFCINTWHGYGPFKKVNAVLPEFDVQETQEYFSYYDLFTTASKFYTYVYRKSFCYRGEILECGAPRNDIFFTNKNINEKIRRLYSIPENKKLILFAPTFRYDKVAAFDKYQLDMSKVINKIEKKFGEKYVLMYRFHHELHNVKERINYFENGIDVTLYSDIQELLVAADIVITDYSSLMWDFSLQGKPVFLYQRDVKEYESGRGFYAPVSEWPYPQAHTQDELLDIIERFDNEKYVKKLKAFLKKYGSCDDGHAAERTVERIMDVINNPQKYLKSR